MSQVRIKQGYTLDALGKKLGLSRQYLWKIEEGKKTLTYKWAYKISKILKCTPDELFYEDAKKK